MVKDGTKSMSTLQEFAAYAAEQWEERAPGVLDRRTRTSLAMVIETFARLQIEADWADDDADAAAANLIEEAFHAPHESAGEFAHRVMEWLREQHRGDVAGIGRESGFYDSAFRGHLSELWGYARVIPAEMTVSQMVREFELGPYGKQTVNGAIKSGRLKARKSGKFWLIRRADAERWIDTRRPGRPAKILSMEKHVKPGEATDGE